MPCSGRQRLLDDGTRLDGSYGSMLPVGAGRRVVCHACGDALSAISAQHARRHGLTLAGYRERCGWLLLGHQRMPSSSASVSSGMMTSLPRTLPDSSSSIAVLA